MDAYLTWIIKWNENFIPNLELSVLLNIFTDKQMQLQSTTFLVISVSQ